MAKKKDQNQTDFYDDDYYGVEYYDGDEDYEEPAEKVRDGFLPMQNGGSH